jgi:hypothetical protein
MLVIVVVVEGVGTLIRQCLFPAPGGEPLWNVYGDLANSYPRVIRRKSVSAGGSRELPSAGQLYGPGERASEARSECIALGRSREPPVFTRFGRISVETKIAG